MTLLLFIVSAVLCIWFFRAGQCKLTQRGYLDPAISPPLAIVLVGSMFILGGIGGWIGMQFGQPDSFQNLTWMYCGALIGQLPTVVIYKVIRRSGESRHILEITIISFAVFVPLTELVASIGHYGFVELGLESATPFGHDLLETISSEPWSGLMFILLICVTIGAGIVEEIMYRGLIFPAIATMLSGRPSGRSIWMAMIITSMIFSLMHVGSVQPSVLCGLFVFSLGLCWARVKSGGVVAPILIHTIFNAMNIAFVYSMSS